MNIAIAISLIIFALGAMLIVAWNSARHPNLQTRIAPFIGAPIQADVWTTGFNRLVSSAVFDHPKTPWGSNKEVSDLVKVSGTGENVSAFRLRQLAYMALGFGVTSSWLSLRIVAHKNVGVPLAVSALLITVLLSGWFALWQLQEKVRKRTAHVESILAVFLELMAFTVAAGQPLIAAMQRVTREISGEFSIEVARMINRIHSGENLTEALHFLDQQFSSAALSRTLHTLDMAMERGTPLSEVLRAQASDARANYARELMVMAGKKETAMLLPVVFFILPMIVGVAIYPGLIALNVL